MKPRFNHFCFIKCFLPSAKSYLIVCQRQTLHCAEGATSFAKQTSLRQSRNFTAKRHRRFAHQTPAEPCNRLWETLPCKVGLYHWHHCSQRPDGSRDKSIVASVGEVCKTASEPLFRVPLIKCRFLYVRLSRAKQVKLKFKWEIIPRRSRTRRQTRRRK